MIVEPRPLVPGRSEPSGTEPSSLPPASGAGDRGVDRGAGDAFGRTLSDMLRADRPDRRAASRRRPGPDDDRGQRADDRRAERPDAAEGSSGRRPGAEDPVPANERAQEQRSSDGHPGDDRPATGSERSTTTDQPKRSADAVEPADERIVETAGTVAATVGLEATAPVEELAPPPLDGDGATDDVAVLRSAAVDVAGTESAAVAPMATSEDAIGVPTSADDVLHEPADATEATSTDDPPARDVAPNPATGILTGLAGSTEGTAAGSAAATQVDVDADDGQTIGARIDTPPSTEGPEPSPAEPGDGESRIARESNGAETSTTTAESNLVAATVATSVGDRAAPAPRAEAASDSWTIAAPSTEVVDASSGRQVVASPLDTDADATNRESRSTEATPESADPSEAEIGSVDVETVDQSTGTVNDRPPSGLAPVPANRSSAPTPPRPAPTTAEVSNPASELVELQTSGLAERLRPAFAAVRRGVNGLEELRLRIQDDNAGPIKVDIATVDNRVRVLLSAGNDDLMRQLGQERDRLAEELRRAGFAQASIDIEAGDRGRRHGRFDQDASGRPGYGVAGPESSGTEASSIDQVSMRRQRGLTGLDLDL